MAKKAVKNKISKHKILERLILVPATGKRMFYTREMTMLNVLCERYSLEFMNIVSFPQKFDSLAYLVSDKLKDTLDRKFRAFNFKVDDSKYDEYHIGEKSGEDAAIKPSPKTIKQFLNEC